FACFSPLNETLGLEQGEQCGYQSGYKKYCPPKQCCNRWGFCGTTRGYCAAQNCQNQCPRRCGQGSDILACPPGFCCSKDGRCGTSSRYCAPENCQSQCNTTAPPIPEGRCGRQAGGIYCPIGQCCNNSGWCGTTPDYCDLDNCQSQCYPVAPPPSPSPPPPSPSPPPPSPSPPPPSPPASPPPPSPSPPPPSPSPPPPPPSLSPPPPSPPPPPSGRCGIQAFFRACRIGECCSVLGVCGTTWAYCAPGLCQSQCFLTSPANNRMRGIESLMLNVV
ncbi:chitin-binding lectin 1-like, partial [Lycium ferocissimum]|uniref:chitin-binding lectin 1-like n=1 Tax=Lycium ferocissimum TaxID=112874 RepID=UPI0028163346